MKERAFAIQPDIPQAGIEGGVAELNRMDVERLNQHLQQGWRLVSIVSNHAGGILIIIGIEEPA